MAIWDVVEVDGSAYQRHARPCIAAAVVSDWQRRVEVVYLIGVAAKATILSEIDGQVIVLANRDGLSHRDLKDRIRHG